MDSPYYDTIVDIYDEAGANVGYLSINPQPGSAPPFFSLSELGVTSADDTVTFYLGIYDGTGLPSAIETIYHAGDILIWVGTKWVRIPTV